MNVEEPIAWKHWLAAFAMAAALHAAVIGWLIDTGALSSAGGAGSGTKGRAGVHLRLTSSAAATATMATGAALEQPVQTQSTLPHEPVSPTQREGTFTAPRRVAALPSVEAAPAGSTTSASRAGGHETAAAGTLAGATSGERGDAGTGTADSGSARAGYFDALHAQVLHALSYPRRAQREGTEGTVVVLLRVDRAGNLAHAEVLQSSGSVLLDRDALRTVRRAAPYGPVPAHLATHELQFELPLEYDLR